MRMQGVEALRAAIVDEAIQSGHFEHISRPPTLASVALIGSVLRLRREGHVVIAWNEFVGAAAADDRELLGVESTVDAETLQLQTVVRPIIQFILNTVSDGQLFA